MSDSLQLWTVALQTPLVHGILQTRILEWVTMPSSRESSQTRNQTHISDISCIAGSFFTSFFTLSLHCRQLLYHWAKLHLKKNFLTLLVKFLSLLNERIEKWSLSKAIWFLNFIHSVLDLCCCPQASLVVVGGAALQLCAQGSHCVGSCCAAWVVGTHAQ